MAFPRGRGVELSSVSLGIVTLSGLKPGRSRPDVRGLISRCLRRSEAPLRVGVSFTGYRATRCQIVR